MQQILLMTILVFFISCGDTSVKESIALNNNQAENNRSNSVIVKEITAQIIDAPLVNLGYRCGKKEGRTDNEGKFTCHEEEAVTFFVGQVEVGTRTTMTIDKKIFLQDLLGLKRDDFSNKKLILMAVFLQSLGDGDNSEVITLSDNVHNSLDKSLQLSTLQSIKEIEELVTEAGKITVSEEEAKEHLEEFSLVYRPTDDSTENNNSTNIIDNPSDDSNIRDDSTENNNSTNIIDNPSDDSNTRDDSTENNNSTNIIDNHDSDDSNIRDDSTENNNSTNIIDNHSDDSNTRDDSTENNNSTNIIDNHSDDSNTRDDSTENNNSTNIIDNHSDDSSTRDDSTENNNSTNIIDNHSDDSNITDDSTENNATDSIDNPSDNSNTTDDSTDTSNHNVTDSTDNNSTNDSNTTDIIVLAIQKTGQIVSYDENGNEVADGTARDDGYYQKGVNSNCIRDDNNETVTDNLTGLMWQDDTAVASVIKQWLSDESYSICSSDKNNSACFDTTGDTADTYCKQLRLGNYEDWRLPTSSELETIIDYGVSNPSTNRTFQNSSSAYYWSSDTIVGDNNYAWNLYFYFGNMGGDSKNIGYYVRCVRSR